MPFRRQGSVTGARPLYLLALIASSSGLSHHSCRAGNGSRMWLKLRNALRPGFDPCATIGHQPGTKLRAMTLRSVLDRPSLRTSLFALAVACTIPTALVACGLVWFFTTKEFDQYERNLSDRAALMLTAIELKVQNVLEDLQILAESPALAAGDFET